MKHVITSLQHPIVKHLVKLREDSQYRIEQRSLVLEGSKPIREVQAHVKKIFYTESEQPIASSATEEWIVTDAILKKISGLSSPEGVIAEVEMPPNASLDHSSSLIILDGVSDPGNMGTLLRTALAFGWDGVYILDGSCDQYNEKVLRAARGAHFKLPIRKGSKADLQQFITKHNFQLLAADLEGERPENIPSAAKRALVLGNEAHGPSTGLRRSSILVSIPMKGDMESLNVAVAGGVLMYVLNRVPYA